MASESDESFDGEISWSCEDSSFEFDNPEEQNEREEAREDLGRAPYRFEPYESEDCGSEEDEESSHELQDETDRIANIHWCRCDCCQPMESQVESSCCTEQCKIVDRMEEETELPVPAKCITQHPGFNSVCLDVHCLRVAYFTYAQSHGQYPDDNPLARYRYTAYRQFVRWCWGILGKEIRIPLPSCVVNKIRSTFPEEGYTGFLPSLKH